MSDEINDSDIQKIIDCVLSAIEKPVDRNVIKKRIGEYLNKYLIDEPDSIKNIVMSEYCAQTSSGMGGTPTSRVIHISDLRDNMVATITARVNDVRVMTSLKTNKQYLILNVNDETGIFVVKVWDVSVEIKKGETYKFKKCRIDEYKGQLGANCDGGKSIEQCDTKIQKNPYELMCAHAVDPSGFGIGEKIVVNGAVYRIWSRPVKEDLILTTGIIVIGGSSYDLKKWGALSINDGDVVCIDNVTIERGDRGKTLKLSSNSNIYRG